MTLPAAEDEQMPGERVLLEDLLGEHGQSVHPLAHVGGTHRQTRLEHRKQLKLWLGSVFGEIQGRVAPCRGLPRRLGVLATGRIASGGGIAWIRGGKAIFTSLKRDGTVPLTSVRTLQILPALSIVPC